MTRAALIIIVGLAGLSGSALHAQERSLYWRALDVEARLDADGRLHVTERQAMVFTGAWNGGERRFRLDAGQRLELQGLSRVDPGSGQEIALTPGDLSLVDHYQWIGSQTLRWRSRLPSDPPFDHSEIAIVIRYTLSNILIPEKDGFLIDHDFAFPDRDGPILGFSLVLDLDPVWQTSVPISGRWRRNPLDPGESFVTRLYLRHEGPGRPAGIHFGAPAGARWALVLALLLFAVLRIVAFFGRERSLGRFEPLVPAGAIDEPWLKDNVACLLPEVVGAAWDDTTGAPEVAAVLARMVAEGKLKSEVRTQRSGFGQKSILHLTLSADRLILSGYEATLIQSLFFDGGTTTDTERIRKHYGSSGFNPAAKLRAPLARRVRAIFRGSSGGPRVSWKSAGALLLAGIGLMLLAGLRRREEMRWLAPSGLIGFGVFLFAAWQAVPWRRQSDRLHLHSLRFLLLALLYASGIALFMVIGSSSASILFLGGLTAFGAGLLEATLSAARSRNGAEQIRLRKHLASARRYFKEQLERRRPEIADAWFPYLIALGLGPHIDRWFRAYGPDGATVSAGNNGRGSFASASGAESASRWTGGGGTFGGAGASGSWASAVGSLASGVAAPSSSSGSGGGGGGGGSSGGGGGGGW